MTSHKQSRTGWVGISLVLATVFTTSAANAHTATDQQQGRATFAPRATLYADNVVVTPGGNTAPAQAAPAPQTVVVPAAQPAAAPAAAQPATESRHKEVHADVASNHNYMSTIAVSALMGALAGALVGGALHYIDNGQAWRNVGYWAAGGVLVGAGVGVIQLMVQENRVSDAVSTNHLPTDPAPTYRLALLNLHF